MMHLIFVVGVTGSGKSQWALKQAIPRREPIINADSVQFYEPLRIGSASPTPQQQQLTPHYLYNVLHYPQEATAGWFRQQVLNLLPILENQHERVFIVGGSFFYLRALIEGTWYHDSPSEHQKYWENEAQKRSFEELYSWIIQMDPLLKKRIHPNDRYRIQRAWIAMKLTGRPLTNLESQKKTLPWPWQKVAISFDPEELKQKLRRRIEKMLAEGLIDEVNFCLKKGWGNWRVLRTSAGYREVLAYLQGMIPDLDTLRERIFRSHWHLVRKQMTWLKKDSSIQWIDFKDDN